MTQRLTITVIPNGPLAQHVKTTSVLISTVDGAKKRYVGTIEAGHQFLSELVTQNQTSSDEAMSIEQQMIEMDVPRNVHVLRDRCKHQPLVTDSAFGFEFCEYCSVSEHIPHGHITRNGEQVSNSVENFADLYITCRESVNDGVMSVNDAMSVLQQAMAGNILLGAAEVKHAITGLPPHIRSLVPVIYLGQGYIAFGYGL